IHTLQDKLKNYEKAVYVTTVKTPYKDGNLCHSDVSVFGEPTEFEYLRKVVFEYMMGRETKTMAKVITSVLKFPPDQTQKILERENARTLTKQTEMNDIVLLFCIKVSVFVNCKANLSRIVEHNKEIKITVKSDWKVKKAESESRGEETAERDGRTVSLKIADESPSGNGDLA
ncbi:hypothetical protein L345_16834, partial [Ophiophagus hannah]